MKKGKQALCIFEDDKHVFDTESVRNDRGPSIRGLHR